MAIRLGRERSGSRYFGGESRGCLSYTASSMFACVVKPAKVCSGLKIQVRGNNNYTYKSATTRVRRAEGDISLTDQLGRDQGKLLANEDLSTFWSIPADQVLERLETGRGGLSAVEAQKRKKLYGPNSFKARKRTTTLGLLLAQFKSPIIIILIFAAVLSGFLGDLTDTIIILTIIFFSAMLGFWQEQGAVNAVKRLLAMVRTRVEVKRDGEPVEAAGGSRARGRRLTARGRRRPGGRPYHRSDYLFVDESVLTGETYPAEKEAGTLPVDTLLARRNNCAFWEPTCPAARRGGGCSHGQEHRVRGDLRAPGLRPPETEFERGVRAFSYFLMEVDPGAGDRHLRGERFRPCTAPCSSRSCSRWPWR